MAFLGLNWPLVLALLRSLCGKLGLSEPPLSGLHRSDDAEPGDETLWAWKVTQEADSARVKTGARGAGGVLGKGADTNMVVMKEAMLAGAAAEVIECCSSCLHSPIDQLGNTQLR